MMSFECQDRESGLPSESVGEPLMGFTWGGRQRVVWPGRLWRCRSLSEEGRCMDVSGPKQPRLTHLLPVRNDEGVGVLGTKTTGLRCGPGVVEPQASRGPQDPAASMQEKKREGA